MQLSLDGVRVLELARFQAGPRGGMMLSDLGAEVISRAHRWRRNTHKSPTCARPERLFYGLQPRQKIDLPRYAQRACEEHLCRARSKIGYGAGEFPARHDGRHGLRL